MKIRHEKKSVREYVAGGSNARDRGSSFDKVKPPWHRVFDPLWKELSQV